MDINPLLERSAKEHSHLCPRQVLGVRIGLAGQYALGFRNSPAKRQMLVICETDGYFVDGLSAATGCTVGHRSLRVIDQGKIAATFVDARSERAIRVAPLRDLRQRACTLLPGEQRPYFAELQAYQLLPDVELLALQYVALKTGVKEILSRPGIRVDCDRCGEEVLNGRQVVRDGLQLCRACAGEAYYDLVPPAEGIEISSRLVEGPNRPGPTTQL